MYEGIDTIALYDELAIEKSWPGAWRPLTSALPPATQSQYNECNVRVLQACLVLDQQAQSEKSEEPATQSAEVARLDMKMNLLLDMVGRLLSQNQVRPPRMPMRFNKRGAVWRPTNGAAHAATQPGSLGVLEIHLHAYLADPLRMVGSISRVAEDGSVHMQFENSQDATADLIDKYIFRKHRRSVAGVRQSKRE